MVFLFVLFVLNVAQNVLESQWFWVCCGCLWKGLQVQKCSTMQMLYSHVRLRDSEFQINGGFYFQLSWVIYLMHYITLTGKLYAVNNDIKGQSNEIPVLI